jgi:hypothetical protein
MIELTELSNLFIVSCPSVQVHSRHGSGMTDQDPENQIRYLENLGLGDLVRRIACSALPNR